MISHLRNLFQSKKSKPKRTQSWFPEWLLSEKFIVSLVGIVVLLVSSRVIFSPSLFHVHDYVHGARIAEMRRGLEQGQFPVRWSENFGYGYGMPLFEFYAPFPYLVGSVWYIVSNNFFHSIKLLWFLPNVLTFVGAYLLGKKLFGWQAGLITAVAFTLAPYRAVNLYLRGAISESWAMMSFPWILWSVMQVWEKGKGWVFSLIGWLTVLFLSHNLMTMFFFPVVLIWIGALHFISDKNLPSTTGFFRRFFSFLSSKSRSKKTPVLPNLYYVLFGIVIAIGLTSFYTVPALAEKDFTQIEERILGGYFHYSQHFLYIRQFLRENWKYGGSNWGPQDDMSFFLGYPQLVTAGVGVAILGLVFLQILRSVRATKRLSWQVFQPLLVTILFLVLLGGALYMSLEKSKWLWDAISPLQVAQFPWRFLSLATVFLALFNGWAISKLSNPLVRGAAVLFFVICSATISWKYFTPVSMLENSSALYYSDPIRIQTEMSGILPDFIPINLDREITPKTSEFENPAHLQYTQHINSAHHKQYLITTENAEVIEFAIADYPGWQVKIDGSVTEHVVSKQGLIETNIPEGQHLVEVFLTRTPVRRNADLVSLICAGILLLFMTTNFILNNKKHDKLRTN